MLEYVFETTITNMNGNFKAISAAILAAAMCTTFTGCAENEASSTNKTESSLNGNSLSNVSDQNFEIGKPESEFVANDPSV